MTAQKVLKLSDLEQDTAVRVEIDGVPIAVVLDGNGEVHAIGDTCTHGDVSLSDGFVGTDDSSLKRLCRLPLASAFRSASLSLSTTG